MFAFYSPRTGIGFLFIRDVTHFSAIQHRGGYLLCKPDYSDGLLGLRFAEKHANGQGTRQGCPWSRIRSTLTEPSPVCGQPLR